MYYAWSNPSQIYSPKMYYAFGFAKIKYLFCVVGAFVNMIVHCNALNLFELVSVYSC